MDKDNQSILVNNEPAEKKPAGSRALAYIFCIAVGLEFFDTVRHLWVYRELARTGAMSVFPVVFGLPGAIALYTATILYFAFYSAKRTAPYLIAAVLFVIAAFFFGLSFRFSGWLYSLGRVPLAGAILSLIGFFIVLKKLINADQS